MTVEIKRLAYNPDALEIAVCTTVTWTNQDAGAHDVIDNAGGFASGMLEKGDTFSFTFDSPGSFRYHWSPHPVTTATIVVS